MKKMRLRTMLSIVLAMMVAVGVWPIQGIAETQQSPLKEVVISDFEQESEDWSFNLHDGPSGTYEHDDAIVKSGAYAGKITADFSDGRGY